MKEIFEIDFPSDDAIQLEIRSIVSNGLPPKEPFISYLLNMYKQLGFKYLFRDVTEIVYVVLMVLAVLGFMSMGLSKRFSMDSGVIYSFIFTTAPVLYLVVAFLFFASVKRRNTYEVEMTCRYNVYQLASLRMLIFSMLCMAINALFIFVLATKYQQINYLQANLISVASLFLFAAAFLFVMLRIPSRFTKYVFAAGWVVLNIGLNTFNKSFYYEFLHDIPGYIYIVLILISLVVFIKHIQQLITFKDAEGQI